MGNDRYQDAKNYLDSLLYEMRQLSTITPSRELSLAITNAEQAQMWLEKVLVPQYS